MKVITKMNERIKQLILECVDFRLDPDSNAYEAQVCPEELECLAELIVRECIWALWTEECRTSDLASEEYTRGSNKIKQHFGIEE